MSNELSLRLEKIVNFCEGSFESIYDLCCDHGKVGNTLADRFPETQVYLIDKVDSIVTNLCSHIPPRDNLQIIKQDCRRMKIYSHKKSLYILSGIGGSLAFDIFSNLSSQDPNGFFLFCLNQNVEELKEKLAEKQQKLIKEDFFIDNEQGYNLFIINIAGSSNLTIFNADLYNFKSLEHKNYISKLVSYYKTKSRFSSDEKNFEYLASLEAILAKF